jgi:hypothetical protein
MAGCLLAFVQLLVRVHFTTCQVPAIALEIVTEGLLLDLNQCLFGKVLFLFFSGLDRIAISGETSGVAHRAF